MEIKLESSDQVRRWSIAVIGCDDRFVDCGLVDGLHLQEAKATGETEVFREGGGV